MATQNYSNHTRRDPKYLIVLLLCLTCFGASIAHVIYRHTPADVLLVPVTFALLLVLVTTRAYALKVQDRVIRVEESLRMQRLGVSAEGLSLKQIIALRFASDAELPALAARARTEQMEPKAIKQAITQWRADDHRV